MTNENEPVAERNPVQGPRDTNGDRASVAWDLVVAVVVFVWAYSLINSSLRLGPIWLVPILVAGLLIVRVLASASERHREARWISFALVALATFVVQASVIELVLRLLRADVDAPYLLRDAALLWVANVIVFGIWYWELDGGGPRVRRSAGYRPTDLAFPQIALGKPFSDGWTPEFIDYLFVAFNASAAFSPTDTSFLSRRSKVLMMGQALNSVVLLAVVAARAINILHQ